MSAARYSKYSMLMTCAEAKLRPVLRELAYNLESFNPLFTAVLLKVPALIALLCI